MDYDTSDNVTNDFGVFAFEKPNTCRLVIACKLDKVGPDKSLVFEWGKGKQRKRHSNVRKLAGKKMKAYEVTAHGICCWKIYPQTHFRGKHLTIGQGITKYPTTNPRSIEIVEC